VTPSPRVQGDDERIFRESQRVADTIFSHYQLSQLLATHARPDSMAQAVLNELVHVCEAGGGAIWLTREPGAVPELVATSGDPAPSSLADTEGESWFRVELEDVGAVALASDPDRPMDAAARRFLSLVRHELAIALRGALLREALEMERAELAAVIQGASDAIVLVDRDRRVTRLNPAAERMLGRTAADIRGETCDRALACTSEGSPPRPCGGRCPFDRVLRHGDPIDGHERTISSSAGTTTAVVGSYAITARDADGHRRAVGILRDTSELARLAELRRGFLGSVSHELRTPIALIRGYVETLLEFEPDRPTARGYLERIDEATRRLGAMVAQILDASALAGDELELRMADVDIGSLVDGAVGDLEVRLPGTPVTLRIDPDVPPVRGDRERLRQVLDNLLGNAAKYREANTAIEVDVTAADGDLTVRIADRGIGVPDDERELVFEQFHRARNIRDRNLPGSGLGLAISRRLVEAHGGSIAFDPTREEGATVVVRLPLAELERRREPVDAGDEAAP
jgi:PAS domain S-box-containing protein